MQQWGKAPQHMGGRLRDSSDADYPPPPPGAFWPPQLVTKGAGLGSPGAPKPPDAPRASKAPEGKFCPLCTPTLSLTPTLTLTPTPTLNPVLTLPLLTRG